MDLLNKRVHHKAFKTGTVTKFTETYLEVKFDVKPVGREQTLKFLYPSAFEGFLVADDKGLQNEILADIQARKEAEQKAKEEKQRLQEAYAISKQQTQKKEKKYKRENIVFKCNYCDGGTTNEQIGYAGVCSKDMIEYNIKVANY